jgi:hypothetical protein
MRNAHLSSDWILPFCRSISVAEATMIWKWALDYCWYSYRNRLTKWLQRNSKLNAEHSFDIHLSVIFDGLSVPQDAPTFQRLSSWEGGTPDRWWFITDCAYIEVCRRWISDETAMEALNVKYTPLLNSVILNVGCGRTALGTGYWHSTNTELPFSLYKDPMTHEWYESQVLLDSYSKGGFLIAHESNKSSAYKESQKTDLLFTE